MALPVTFLITDLHRGGSPLMLAALAGGLKARGNIVPEVVSIAPLGEVADLLLAKGLEVSSLGARHNRDLRVVGRFVRHLRRHDRGIVCSMLVHANLLAAMSKPFVDGWGWVQSLQTLQERPRWHWYAQGAVGGVADAFVAPTTAIVKKLDAYGGMPRATVIPNGIDVTRFRDAAPMAPVPWPGGVKVVGYVGRFDPVKRLEVVVEALVGMQGVHLALVGYGAQERTLRGQVEHLGLQGRVHFVGASRTPERWYKCMDVMVSASEGEGYGLTLVEARAAQVPVVVCETDAVREVLGTDPGVVWMPKGTGAVGVRRAIESAFEKVGKVGVGKVVTEEEMVARWETLLLAVGREKGLGA